MTDEQYLTTLVKEIAPDNGVEFLSSVVRIMSDEHMLKRIVHVLEMSAIEEIENGGKG